MQNYWKDGCRSSHTVGSKSDRSSVGIQHNHKMATGHTHFEIVYGTEAVLPFEIELPAFRITSEQQLSTNEMMEA